MECRVVLENIKKFRFWFYTFWNRSIFNTTPLPIAFGSGNSSIAERFKQGLIDTFYIFWCLLPILPFLSSLFCYATFLKNLFTVLFTTSILRSIYTYHIIHIWLYIFFLIEIECKKLQFAAYGQFVLVLLIPSTLFFLVLPPLMPFRSFELSKMKQCSNLYGSLHCVEKFIFTKKLLFASTKWIISF